MWYSIAAIGPSGLLHSMRFPVELNTGVSEFSGFVAENYGGSSELKRTLMAGAADVLLLRGNNKLYLVEDWLNLMGWDKVCHRPHRRHAPAASPPPYPKPVPTAFPPQPSPPLLRRRRPAHHDHHHRSLTRSSSCSAPSLASQSTSLAWVATATRRCTWCRWTRRVRTPPTIVTSRQVSKFGHSSELARHASLTFYWLAATREATTHAARRSTCSRVTRTPWRRRCTRWRAKAPTARAIRTVAGTIWANCPRRRAASLPRSSTGQAPTFGTSGPRSTRTGPLACVRPSLTPVR